MSGVHKRETATERLDRIIESSGLSMRALAKKYSIPYDTFTKWKYGSRKPPGYVLIMLELCERCRLGHEKEQENN